MFKSFLVLSKVSGLGSSFILGFAVIGVIFWRPILKKIYILMNKKGIICYTCKVKTQDFLVDRNFNPWCRKCGNPVKNEKWF
jgi:hypothetical protein